MNYRVGWHNYDWFTVDKKFVTDRHFCDECGDDFDNDDVGRVALIDIKAEGWKYLCPNCTSKMFTIIGLEKFLENLGCDGVIPDED